MKLKLSTKLLCGFLVISLIGAGIGIFGIIQLNASNAGVDFLDSQIAQPLSYLVHMKSNFVEERLTITKAGMAKSTAAATEYQRTFLDLDKQNQDLNKKFEATINNPEDQRLWEDYKRTEQIYAKIGGHIIALVVDGQVKEANEKILDTSDTGAAAQGRNHQASMDRLVESKERITQEATRKIHDAGGFSVVVMIAATLISFLISVLLGLWLGIIQISRPLAGLTSTLHSGSLQISAASTQLSSSAQEIANGATEQASSVEETSASMEELSSMVKQNLANSRETSLLAGRASDAAQEGFQDMQRMVEAMKQIAESSEAVGKVNKLIEDIAFKTNILALNAAVEAARAGEAGLGFAVVADEVKNLANRSADAANETSGMIRNSIKKITEGNQLAERLAEVFKTILSNSRKVAEMSKEVEVASTQQDTGINQVTKAIIQFDQVVQANASASEETASSAEELSSQAANLMNLVRDLTALVNGADTITSDRMGNNYQPSFQANYRNQSPPNYRPPVGDQYYQGHAPTRPSRSGPTPTVQPGNRAGYRDTEISPEKLIPFENDEDYKD